MTPRNKATSKRAKERAAALAKTQDPQGFLDNLHREGDRAAAILAAAMLDEMLRQVLEAFFVDDAVEVARLLDNEQPLGAFGARIRIAYCLGLLAVDEFKQLTLIKAIRNHFAHKLHGLSFEESTIVADCARLKQFVKAPEAFVDTPRKIFLSATSSVWLSLWATRESVAAKGRRKIPVWETLAEYHAEPESGSE